MKKEKELSLKIQFTRSKKKSTDSPKSFCYISDYIVNIVYTKKHCKTFNKENKIHRVKITSYPDPEP